MAAEVEKLADIVPAAEAKSFLKARCNLPATELSTYLRFAKTLKGSEEVLQKTRASFPVVKALVSADAETRREVLERMEIGARIDTKDVATIRRKLAAVKLTVSEALTAENRKIVAAAARKHVKSAIASFEEKMSSFSDELRLHFRKGQADRVVVQAGLRHQAGRLLVEFESLFGGEQPPLASLKRMCPAYRIANAHKVLSDIASGQLSEIGPMQTSAMQAVAGRARVQADFRPKKPLKDVARFPLRPRVFELCAGAGGLALGLERAGFVHVGLVEHDKNAVATLQKNRPNWPVVTADVRRVDFTPYREQRVDLLAGGLPCTPFTTVGKRQGKADENDLMMEGVRAVREIAPKAFVFENVEGLLHSKHSDYLAFLLRKFSKAGYVTDIHRLNSRDYGVAQDRSRIMIVGFRKDLAGVFRMPPTLPGMATNMGDVLHDLMSENGWNGADDWVRMMRERPEFDRFGNPLGVGALSDTIRGYQGSPKEGEARRALMNGVSYAPSAKAAPTNAEAEREGFVPGLTTRMRARLQGFPDAWAFVGGIGSVTDQIGNAVAPAVGQAVGLAFLSALTGWEFDWEAMLSYPHPQSNRRVEVSPPSMTTELRETQPQAIKTICEESY
jgi:DNA (cytosine-5)-methyltransferase 1